MYILYVHVQTVLMLYGLHEAWYFLCRLKKIQEKKKKQKLKQEKETVLRLAALRERAGGGGRWNDPCGSSFNLRLHLRMLYIGDVHYMWPTDSTHFCAALRSVVAILFCPILL